MQREENKERRTGCLFNICRKTKGKYIPGVKAIIWSTATSPAVSAQVCLRLSIPLTNQPIKLRPPTQHYETSHGAQDGCPVIIKCWKCIYTEIMFKDKKKVPVFKENEERKMLAEAPRHKCHPLRNELWFLINQLQGSQSGCQPCKNTPKMGKHVAKHVRSTWHTCG